MIARRVHFWRRNPWKSERCGGVQKKSIRFQFQFRVCRVGEYIYNAAFPATIGIYCQEEQFHRIPQQEALKTNSLTFLTSLRSSTKRKAAFRRPPMAEVTSAQIHRYTVQKILPAPIVYRKAKTTSSNPRVSANLQPENGMHRICL